MCSITLALAGLTTGLQMAGQYQQSRAQASAYNAQAEAAKRQAEAAYQNARIQNRKSEQIAENYAREQQQLDNKRRLIIGQQNAQMGASGLAGGVGSALDIYNATQDAYEQDSLNLLSTQRNTMYDNYVQEVNMRNQGNEYTAQSANYKAQASAAKSAGNWAMVGTLLSGAASMYGMKGVGGSSSSGNTAFYGGPQAGSAGYITGTPAVNSAWGSATAGFGSGVNNFSVLNKSYKSVWG